MKKILMLIMPLLLASCSYFKSSKDIELIPYAQKEKYGYFVRLEPGIEGLIHESKLSGTEKIEIGKKIKAFIERVNKASRRLSLILPQTEKPVMYR